MNTALLTALAEFGEKDLPAYLATHPNDSFNMETWKQREPCGTACCFAGWAVAVGPLAPTLEFATSGNTYYISNKDLACIGDTMTTLAVALGIPVDFASLLFLRRAYSFRDAVTPATVAARIRSLIELGPSLPFLTLVKESLSYADNFTAIKQIEHMEVRLSGTA